MIGSCRHRLALVAVLAIAACAQRQDATSSTVEEVTNATCAHELTCAGGPLVAGSSSSGGCLPTSGNANGWCVHEVCADSNHAYCCSSKWDNGCAQFAATFTRSAGFGFDDCPTPAQNPVPSCPTASCTPTTCAAQGATCGTVSDGCGGVLTCGTCPGGQACTNNTCGAGTNPAPGACAHDLTCTGAALASGCDSGTTVAGCVAAVCGFSSTKHCCTSAGSGATWDPSCVAELHFHTACKDPNPPANPVMCSTGGNNPGAICTAAGANCGTISDGNGGTVNCGTCAAPGTCGGGGTANQCGCTTKACPAGATGDSCGTVPDGCGGTLNCACESGDTCSGASSGTCQPACVPKTCGSGGVGSVCGSVSDGCGGSITCTCPVGETCGGNGTCQASATCTPTTCAAQGDTCGSIPDGCGGTLSCGSCPSGDTCSPSNTCQPTSNTINLPSPTLPPVKLANLSFGMFGDTRPPSSTTAAYPQNVKTIITAIFSGLQAQKVPLVVGSGDYAFSSTSAGSAVKQYTDYMTARKQFTGTYLPTMGNHECNGFTDSNCPIGSFTGMTQDYVNTILTPSTGQASPWYSALYLASDGSWSAKFIFVAANAWDTKQQSWLKSTLAVNTTYTFIVRHEPANDARAPGVTPSETMLGSAFTSGTLTLSITGHTHLVQLPGGTKPYGDSFGATKAYEIIVGNGGAPLDAGPSYGYAVATRRTSDGAIVFQMFQAADSSGKPISPNTADTNFRFAVNANGTTNASTTLP